MKIPTVYSMNLVALDEDLVSPSARKPRELANLLKQLNLPIQWIAAEPVSIQRRFLSN